MRIPELLAPAGGMDAFLAAVAAGADAVYLGLRSFNARAAATGLSVGELARACALAHGRGVRVYVTLNVLVRDGELSEACALAGEALAAGADALIVADAGLCRLLARAYPGVELHLSTQAGAHSASAAALAARELGVSRVTCGRELSVDEIAEMAKAGAPQEGALNSTRGLPCKPRVGSGGCMPGPKPSAYEVEAFCHGAICICYAGACAFSAIRRQRSANRGDCTQPCRVPYDLVDETGASVVGIEGDRLLCPRDYLGIRHVARLVEAGVAALKIEGRMKNPDYVYNVVRCYRQALDALASGSPLDGTALDALEAQLGRSFNRGFTSAYPAGERADGRLMSWERACNQGMPVGEVVERRHEEVVVAFSRPVGAGDTLEIRSTPGPDAPPDVPKRWPMVSCPADVAAGERLPIRCKRKVEAGSAVHLVRDASLVAEAAAMSLGLGRALKDGLVATSTPSARSKPRLPSGGSGFLRDEDHSSGYRHLSPDAPESPPPLYAWQLLDIPFDMEALRTRTVVLDEIHRPADDARVRELCRHAAAVVCRNLGQLDIARAVGVPFEVAAPLAVWNGETARWLHGLGARRIWPPEELVPGDAPQLMVTEHCVLTAEGPCDGRCASCPRRHELRYLVEQDGTRLRVLVDALGRTRIVWER